MLQQLKLTDEACGLKKDKIFVLDGNNKFLIMN